jgi:hypothetical protein
MSYAELDDHPRKHELMSAAFTLQSATSEAEEVWREQAKSKAKLNA